MAVIGDILQPTHLLFVLVIALLVLGPKRLPEVGRSLGRGLRDFRQALSGDEIRQALTGEEPAHEPVLSHEPVLAQTAPDTPARPTEPAEHIS
jgi:sec-independent protein translocase protein TatA